MNAPPLPRAAYVPVVALAALFVAIYVPNMFRGMGDWGVSADALRHGHAVRLLTHMAAHASLIHIGLNLFALWTIGPVVVSRLGPTPDGWLRFVLLFGLGGVAGALVFVAVHPFGSTPVIGASGAIYALVGALVRLGDGTGPPRPLRSPETRAAARDFVKTNLQLMLFFTLPALLAGSPGGLAWEAHLGGFVFGLVAGPMFRSRAKT